MQEHRNRKHIRILVLGEDISEHAGQTFAIPLMYFNNKNNQHCSVPPLYKFKQGMFKTKWNKR